MRPAALTNLPPIDEKPGSIAVNLRDLTWNDAHRHLPYEIRLLLSLTNAAGAGRMRQAAREPVKAYIHGLDSAAPDDVFELPARNRGIGFFSSGIGPSALFAAYKTIRNTERQGRERSGICETLREKFGEKDPDVSVQEAETAQNETRMQDLRNGTDRTCTGRIAGYPRYSTARGPGPDRGRSVLHRPGDQGRRRADGRQGISSRGQKKNGTARDIAGR